MQKPDDQVSEHEYMDQFKSVQKHCWLQFCMTLPKNKGARTNHAEKKSARLTINQKSKGTSLNFVKKNTSF